MAPYEADGQLAWLAQHGHIWAAATVDSDFIIHGIERVFFRVTWSSGSAAMWERSKAADCSIWPNEDLWKTPFLLMLAECGLGFLTAYSLAAGCDYGTKVDGIGPGKALTACRRLKNEQGAACFNALEDNLSFLAAQLKALAKGSPPPPFMLLLLLTLTSPPF